MDGVHDLGGREGFGPIVGKTDDKVIHADWEIRDFAMKQSSAAGQSWTIDWFRHCRELADPIDYLTRPYYDQWLTTLAAQLIDEGYLSLDEIKRGASAFVAKPGLPPQTAEAARADRKKTAEFRRRRQYAAALRDRRGRALPARWRPPAIRACLNMCGAGRGSFIPITAAMFSRTRRRGAKIGASISIR